MASMKIKRDDVVVVTAGKNKGQTGRVLRVLTAKNRVVVERVNLVKRHVKPQGDRPGGTIEKEAPIHISNVALWNAAEGRPMKVGFKFLDDGRKVRFDRKTGEIIDNV
ncbi:MAG: 50S ribosomal protein L24 [Deltaproteobacteria bacterium]|nr:MAG: 50S ribosomal protein L24 [Deltaproteobacteria bacterium]